MMDPMQAGQHAFLDVGRMHSVKGYGCGDSKRVWAWGRADRETWRAKSSGQMWFTGILQGRGGCGVRARAGLGRAGAVPGAADEGLGCRALP